MEENSTMHGEQRTGIVARLDRDFAGLGVDRQHGHGALAVLERFDCITRSHRRNSKSAGSVRRVVKSRAKGGVARVGASHHGLGQGARLG